jgi:hypothetical protein
VIWSAVLVSFDQAARQLSQSRSEDRLGQYEPVRSHLIDEPSGLEQI